MDEELDIGQEQELEPAADASPEQSGDFAVDAPLPGSEAAQEQTQQSGFDEARLEAMIEQRLGKILGSTLQQPQQPRYQQPRAPGWTMKPQNQWDMTDWQEYNQNLIDERVTKATAESEWRGRLNATALGAGRDYDSVMRTYTSAISPEDRQFLNQLDPPARYMLALAHELFQANNGDLPKTINTIRGALSARQAGANDVRKSLTSGARKASMRMIGGGGGQRGTSQPQTYDNMDDAAFGKVIARVSGGN